MRLERREGAPAAAAGRLGEGTGAERGLTGAVRGEPAVAGEAPGAVDEYPDADPLALDVADRFDATVLGGDRLRAAKHAARICVRGTGGDRSVDGEFAKVAQGANSNEGRVKRH